MPTNKRRTTIYDIAKALFISVSYVSKALNDHPSINEEMKKKVKEKAKELNFQQRVVEKVFTKTIGVVVPHLNKKFFFEAITGIEEVCVEHGFKTITCQSYESYQKEVAAVETLIHQNVDCILISVSLETDSSAHLELAKKKNIEVIQFDRYLGDFVSHKVTNNNEEVTTNIVKYLVKQGYRRIAFIGGPEKASVYRARKKGYLKGLQDAAFPIINDLICDCSLSKEEAFAIATWLLSLQEPPDAFITISDSQSLGVHMAVQSVEKFSNKQIAIIGFANELLTQFVTPDLSSVEQHSAELGRKAAYLYFKILKKRNEGDILSIQEQFVVAEIIERASTRKKDS